MVRPNTSKKSDLKGVSLKENLDFDDESLNEIFHNFNLQMEIAMQIFSNDKTK